jgi:hypothetical protein
VSAALKAAKDAGRAEEQARIVAILRSMTRDPERFAHFMIAITGKDPTT